LPIINISITAKPDAGLSRKLAKAVTELTRSHLRKNPTITAVAIHHVDPEHWFAGGCSLAEQGLATFWLDIKVVDGTNTKVELASYLEAVFTTVSGILGPTHSESYVLVHEVPAAAYGFGGKTQEFRFISGRMQTAATAA
jgi:4-oxalocrotonate tautomerase